MEEEQLAISPSLPVINVMFGSCPSGVSSVWIYVSEITLGWNTFLHLVSSFEFFESDYKAKFKFLG